MYHVWRYVFAFNVDSSSPTDLLWHSRLVASTNPSTRSKLRCGKLALSFESIMDSLRRSITHCLLNGQLGIY